MQKAGHAVRHQRGWVHPPDMAASCLWPGLRGDRDGQMLMGQPRFWVWPVSCISTESPECCFSFPSIFVAFFF